MDTMNIIFAEFIARMNDEFLGAFLNYANEIWIGYYAIFIVPTMIFLVISGLQYMTGNMEGDKFRTTVNKFGKYLIFALLGYGFLPSIEHIETGLETLISNKAASAKISMVDKAEKKANIYNARYDAERNKFIELYNKQFNVSSFWDYDNTEAVNFLQKAVTYNREAMSKLDAEDVSELQAQAGIAYNIKNDAEAATKNADRISKMMSIESNTVQNEDDPMWSMSFWGFITVILNFLAGLLEVLVRMVRMFIIIILRFTFPIALSLSIIPSMEHTIKSWWESYTTILLWGLMLIIIKLIISFAGNITVGFEDGSIQFVSALYMFIGGVFYLLSPNITVMCFGGSASVSQLPQQMVQSMSAVGAAAGIMAGWTKQGFKFTGGAMKYADSQSGGKLAGNILRKPGNQPPPKSPPKPI